MHRLIVMLFLAALVAPLAAAQEDEPVEPAEPAEGTDNTGDQADDSVCCSDIPFHCSTSSYYESLGSGVRQYGLDPG